MTAEEVPAQDRIRSISHLCSTVLTACQHLGLHLEAAKEAVGNPERVRFNLNHCENHLAEVIEHAQKLIAVLVQEDPGVGIELDKLHAVTELNADAGTSDEGRSYEATMRAMRADVLWQLW